MAKRKTLTPRQTRFVAAYISGKGGAESARLAGYSPASSRGRAYELLNENETVMAAIAEAQAELRKEANFNAEKAMDELNEAMKFARETKNATALARCIELRAKLAGLLDVRDKGPTAAFQININGIDTPEAGALSIYD
jgi:phage terminase small subunit